MAQLNTIRQRIKTIETIQKITHAMRLISISTHSKLKNKKGHLEYYKDNIGRLLSCININHEQETPKNNKNQKELILLIGSEKGLAGNFNVQLFKYFELNSSEKSHNYDLITIGKNATDYALSENKKPILHHNTLNSNNFISIANIVSDHILTNQSKYNKITTYSNMPKTFFIQKPNHKQIWPLSTKEYKSLTKNNNSSCTLDSSHYIFEQNPKFIYDQLVRLYIKTTLQEVLFNSLLAEQAARFVSMDSSTRNAEKLLASTKLEYNKERQALITRELTELSSNFM